MKKRLLILVFLFLVLLFVNVNINAITYDDSNNAGYNPTSSDQTLLNGGVTHIKALGYTIRNNIQYPQQVNVLSMKTSETAKVATWAISNGAGFTRATVASIARDYEQKHPGWKVIGAMNADQYYTKSGTGLTADGSAQFYPQPYYPMIADYEKWFAITATPYLSGHVVGFLNDGSSDQLIYKNAGWGYQGEDKVNIKGLYLSVYKDGNLHKFKIDKFNVKPNEGESSIFSPYYLNNNLSPITVTGGNIYVVSGDLAYTSNSTAYVSISPHNQNAFFGKGKITKIESEVSLLKGQFAIQTNNRELLDFLAIDDYVVAQYEFEGQLNEVESAIGFHKIMRVDNQDKPMTGDYNIKSYPRAIFGRKSDGTIVFVTVDGSQASKGMTGVNMEESNAILKHYGVVEAYQLDGGGSVTMVIRDGDKFVTVNSPSDGSDRQVLSALLFVVKDIDVEEDITIMPTSIKFNLNVKEDNITKLYIKLNNETKAVINNQVEFTNLSPNTPYKYQYLYEKDGTLITSPSINSIYTAKRTPILDHLEITRVDNNVTIKPIFTDPDKAITYVRIILNEEPKNLYKDEVIYENVTDIDLHNIQIIYRYDVNDGTSEKVVDTKVANLHPDIKIFLNYIISTIYKKIGKIYK